MLNTELNNINRRIDRIYEELDGIHPERDPLLEAELDELVDRRYYIKDKIAEDETHA